MGCVSTPWAILLVQTQTWVLSKLVQGLSLVVLEMEVGSVVDYLVGLPVVVLVLQ